MILNGVYSKTVYRNAKTGYTVFRFKPDEACEYANEYGLVSCCGKIPLYVSGIPLSMDGMWEASKYGMTFSIVSVEEKFSNRKTAVDYLSSGICEGIGPKIAEKIVDTCGLDIFEHIQDEDIVLKLAEVKGISQERASKLTDSLRKTVAQRKIFEFLTAYNGDYPMALRLYKRYGVGAVKKLKEDPYSAGYEADIPFNIRDMIAHDNGVTKYDEERIKNVIYQSLYNAAASGHTYVGLHELKRSAGVVSKGSAFPEDIPTALLLRGSVAAKNIVIENNERIFLRKYYDAEKNISKQLKRLELAKSKLPFDDWTIEWAKMTGEFELGEEQERALNVLKTSGVKIITGGPGVGKTTTLKEIIRIYERIMPEKSIRLAAPTGRAAQRMAEATGKPATTIHRLIEYRPFDEVQTSIEELDGDFFIFDEMSMVDVLLFSMLLSAVPSGATVLLVGDENQLEAVGAGNVLHDLIDAGIETYKLTEIFRQDENNSIVTNYVKIHKNNWKLTQDESFEIIHAKNAEEVLQKTLDLIKEYHDSGRMDDMQVLSTTRKYDCGTFNVNKEIQQIVNTEKGGLYFGNYLYKLHDRVLLTRNNYDKNYYNGDVGEITKITNEEITIQLYDNEVTLGIEDMDDLSLAYAMTTHKAQGSEYNTVVVMLPMKPVNMLQLRLFGTAISRAKEKVYVIAENGALDIIRSGRFNTKRNSALNERIKSWK